MSLQVEEVRISLPHIELAAHLFGPPDGKPVIALHGWLDNAMSFSRLAPKLAGLRIVALDFAGHGHSAHRAEGASYLLWDYALDVLMVAEQLGWERFSLLGHSMGAIVSVLLAGALPERIERLALIDGLIPYTGEADKAPQKLGEALKAQLALRHKRKPVYAELEKSRGSADARGRRDLPGGRRTARPARPGTGARRLYLAHRRAPDLPSPLRLTQAHALNFVRSVECPVSLVLAEQGMLAVEPRMRALLETLPFERHHLPGGHHLHLDDEAGAQAVARVFAAFFAR